MPIGVFMCGEGGREKRFWVEVKLQRQPVGTKRKMKQMCRKKERPKAENADNLFGPAFSAFLRPVSWKALKDWKKQRLITRCLVVCFELFYNSVNCRLLTVMQIIIVHRSASYGDSIYCCPVGIVQFVFICKSRIPDYLYVYVCFEFSSDIIVSSFFFP